MEYKFEISKNIDRFLATLSKMYGLDGNRQLQELIVNAQPKVHERWDSDSWSTVGHALYLTIPEKVYLNVIKDRFDLQNKLRADINNIHNIQDEQISEVFLEMASDNDSDWRKESGLLIAGTRSVSEDATKRIWEDNSFRLFLSHKTTVKKETAELKERLRVYGISCFVAHEDIHPTKEWQEEIENALASMDGFAALLTTDFNDSDWTDQEVGYALARGVPMIAVKLGKDPYGFIGKFQALPGSWSTAAEGITGILITTERMFNAYLEELRKCPNWDHANVLGKLLASIKSLNPKQIDELIVVYNETMELHGAFAFDGTKPLIHGPGLVSHLNRIDSRKFRFTKDMSVEIAK